jgi:hypothetical protein
MPVDGRRAVRVFISHAASDEDIAHIVVDLLHVMGVPVDQIFCSSAPETGIAPANEFKHDIREALRSAELVLLLISKRYRSSDFCVAEANAGWGLATDCVPIVIPPAQLDDVPRVFDGTQGINIDAPQDWNKLLECVCGKLGLTEPNRVFWERRRDEAIQKLKSPPTSDAQSEVTAVPPVSLMVAHVIALLAVVALGASLLTSIGPGWTYALERTRNLADYLQLAIVSVLVMLLYFTPWDATNLGGGWASRSWIVTWRALWLWWWMIYAAHSMDHVLFAFDSGPNVSWLRSSLQPTHVALVVGAVTSFYVLADTLETGKALPAWGPIVPSAVTALFLAKYEQMVGVAWIVAAVLAGLAGLRLLRALAAAKAIGPSRLGELYCLAQIVFSFSFLPMDRAWSFGLAIGAKILFIWFKLHVYAHLDWHLRPKTHDGAIKVRAALPTALGVELGVRNS